MEVRLVCIEGKWQSVPLGQKHPGLEKAERKERDLAEKRAMQKAASQIPRTCSNCRSIRYSGIHESTHSMGTCCRSRESGQIYVKPDHDSCPLWSRRTDYKMQVELKKSAELIKLASEVRSSRR